MFFFSKKTFFSNLLGPTLGRHREYYSIILGLKCFPLLNFWCCRVTPVTEGKLEGHFSVKKKLRGVFSVPRTVRRKRESPEGNFQAFFFLGFEKWVMEVPGGNLGTCSFEPWKQSNGCFRLGAISTPGLPKRPGEFPEFDFGGVLHNMCNWRATTVRLSTKEPLVS